MLERGENEGGMKIAIELVVEKKEVTTDTIFSLNLMLEQNKSSKIALNERRNISKSMR